MSYARYEMDSSTPSSEVSSRLLIPNEQLSFHRFPELPFELRCLIWELTIEPRVVQLRQRHVFECYCAVQSVPSNRSVSGKHPDCACESPQDAARKSHGRIDRIRGRPYGYHLMGFTAESRLPSVLLACHESYSIASRAYTKSFSALGAIAQTWIGFKLDTLYLEKRSEAPGAETLVQGVLPYMCLDELAQIERLAINHDLLPEAIGTYENYLANILTFFTSVKRVYLVKDPQLAKGGMPALGSSERASESLELFGDLGPHHRGSAPKDREACTASSNCLQPACWSIELSEDDVHREGVRICRERGKQWPTPIFEFNKTISTSSMRSELESIQQQCRKQITCGCYGS